jgi:hypothetical protein
MALVKVVKKTEGITPLQAYYASGINHNSHPYLFSPTNAQMFGPAATLESEEATGKHFKHLFLHAKKVCVQIIIHMSRCVARLQRGFLFNGQ